VPVEFLGLERFEEAFHWRVVIRRVRARQ